MMCKHDFFFFSPCAMFRSSCKALSVISAACFGALITSFIPSLARVIIMWRDKLCIVPVWYLKNNRCISPHQPIKPLSIQWRSQAVMLITCEKPFIYWLVKCGGWKYFPKPQYLGLMTDDSFSLSFSPPVQSNSPRGRRRRQKTISDTLAVQWRASWDLFFSHFVLKRCGSI